MRSLFVATTMAALAVAVALAGCERGSRESRGGEPPLAQVDTADSGFGLPNPMPGSPIADGGITPITPTPTSSPGNPLPLNPTPGPIPSH